MRDFHQKKKHFYSNKLQFEIYILKVWERRYNYNFRSHFTTCKLSPRLKREKTNKNVELYAIGYSKSFTLKS